MAEPIWCDWQLAVMEDGKPAFACGAHLAEGRCMLCHHKVEHLIVESFDRKHYLKPQFPGPHEGGDGVCRDWEPPKIEGKRPRPKLPLTENILKMLQEGQWERAAGDAQCSQCGKNYIDHCTIDTVDIMIVDCSGRVWKL